MTESTGCPEQIKADECSNFGLIRQ